MLFTGTYMLNLLCAIVPCQATMAPPEAHIRSDLLSSQSERSAQITLPFNSNTLDPTDYNSPDSRGELKRNKRVDNLTTATPTPPKYPNLENPVRTLMQAFRKGMEHGERYTNNFGNRMHPYSEQPARLRLSSNAKRNADHDHLNDNLLGAGGNLKETKVLLRNGDAVEGFYMGTMKGRRFVAFQGIPYAEPPVKHLRFRPPVPKRPWHGLLMATRPGSECLQGHPIKMFRISGSEDCLFLNIYTPKTSSSPNKGNSGLLPVIFFIHGGSFMYGSGSEYGPAYLLDEDVVLVTFNYRLGALGFMSTFDSSIPGNFGLRDQALALKWVYDNVEQFGGDSKRVTLLGQSAGGIAAHLHLLANKTTSYFQNGISLSGSAFGFWPVVPKERALGFTKRLGKSLRCPQEDTSKMVQCLRGLRADFIVGAQLHFFSWIPFHPIIVFAPVIEAEGPDSYLTKSPGELYASGNVESKPWIFGQTSQEGHFETHLINLFMQTPIVKPRIKDLLPIVLDYKEFTKEPERAKLTQEILQFYKWEGAGNKKPMEIISDMYTDRIFTNGIQEAIRTHGSVFPNTTYAYIFDYMGTSNLGQAFGASKSEWGVVHTEDLFFLFNSSVFHHGFKRKDPGYQLSQIMTNLMANFAHFGEPLHTDESGKNIKIWEPSISLESAQSLKNSSESVGNLPIRYLKFKQNIEMTPDPYSERNRFWKSLQIAM